MAPAMGDECPRDDISEGDSASYVPDALDAGIDLIINQYGLQPEQLANQPRIDERAILAVVTTVEERLLDGHLLVPPKQIVVAREVESVLH